MTIPTDTPGSAGRTPAVAHQPGPDPSSSCAVRRPGVGPGVVVGVGRDAATTAGDGAPFPPLPLRDPAIKTWPAGIRFLSHKGRSHVVRPVNGQADTPGQWILVVLDSDGCPQDALPGFDSREAADTYAESDPDIARWKSVPRRPDNPDLEADP